MAHPFLDRIARGPILGDGAMGTQLYAHGIDLEGCFDAVNLDNLDLVRTIHRDYINAGSELIETNTYGANRLKLERFGLGDRVADINKRALRAARDAREIGGQTVLIAGAVGPLGAVLEPYGNLKPAKAREVFAEQIAVLLEQGADLLMFETFGDLQELLLAIDAARSVGDLPIVAQMSFDSDGRTAVGNTPEEVVRALVARDVAMIGVNCSVGPQRLFKVVEAMHIAEPNARLAAQPNAGWPTELNNRILYPSTPEYVARYARRMIEELGVSLVGGCCGTTPDHIAAIRGQLTSLQADAVASHVHVVTSPEPARRAATAVPQTLLAQKIEAGEFIVSVEIDPPKGHNPRKCIDGALMLKEVGVNFINVADSPMSRVRMGPLAMCSLIQRETGLETIIHFTTRDRSLMGLQSDLLGAHALNIRNVLTLKGDPPTLGNYPGTSGVFDVDTLGLVRI
ncbi:MAG: 5,10-methylenetetrahydrofolate reductase / Homolog of homocysteine-binding domain, partial [uncultured Chloroflexia bacterium]